MRIAEFSPVLLTTQTSSGPTISPELKRELAAAGTKSIVAIISFDFVKLAGGPLTGTRRQQLAAKAAGLRKIVDEVFATSKFKRNEVEVELLAGAGTIVITAPAALIREFLRHPAATYASHNGTQSHP